jgi:histone-arginine methyltransferase CARM1
VVVDAFDPHHVVSSAASRVFDFATITEADLQEITIPLELAVAQPCAVHGLATWFDVLFDGSSVQACLSTAPGAPTTHWCAPRGRGRGRAALPCAALVRLRAPWGPPLHGRGRAAAGA